MPLSNYEENNGEVKVEITGKDYSDSLDFRPNIFEDEQQGKVGNKEEE